MLGLGNKQWLNDEVINFYMEMLIKREEAISSPKSLYLSTFFFLKLTEGYEQVKKWTKKKDIFSMRYIFSAINTNLSHWKLIYWIPVFKVIVIYCPLGHNKKDAKKYGLPALQVNMKNIFIIIIHTLFNVIVGM